MKRINFLLIAPIIYKTTCLSWDAINLVLHNADVFSKHEFDLGLTNLLTHRIDTGQSEPLAEPRRRHPIVYLDHIDQTVEKMM